MKTKKESADWYISATHWLTSIIGMTIFGAILVIILAIVYPNPEFIAYGYLVIYPLMMWLAVKYSAKYVNKTYVIKNVSQIVTLSTIYMVIVGGGFRVIGFASKGIVTPDNIGFLLATIVFYFASKKYLKVG